jgi:hypothetical protein
MMIAQRRRMAMMQRDIQRKQQAQQQTTQRLTDEPRVYEDQPLEWAKQYGKWQIEGKELTYQQIKQMYPGAELKKSEEGIVIAYQIPQQPEITREQQLQMAREEYQQQDPLTQFGRAFFAGATRFPQLIWGTAAHTWATGDIGKGVQKAGEDIILAEYTGWKQAKAGKAGEWVTHQVLLSPAITDVVLPLAGAVAGSLAFQAIGKAGAATLGLLGKGLSTFARTAPWVVGGIASGMIGGEIGYTAALEQKGMMPKGTTVGLITRRGIQIGGAVAGAYYGSRPETLTKAEILGAKIKHPFQTGWTKLQQQPLIAKFKTPVTQYAQRYADLRLMKTHPHYQRQVYPLRQRLSDISKKLYEPTPRDIMIREGFLSYRPIKTIPKPLGKLTQRDIRFGIEEATRMPTTYQAYQQSRFYETEMGKFLPLIKKPMITEKVYFLELGKDGTISTTLIPKYRPSRMIHVDTPKVMRYVKYVEPFRQIGKEFADGIAKPVGYRYVKYVEPVQPTGKSYGGVADVGYRYVTQLKTKPVFTKTQYPRIYHSMEHYKLPSETIKPTAYYKGKPNIQTPTITVTRQFKPQFTGYIVTSDLAKLEEMEEGIEQEIHPRYGKIFEKPTLQKKAPFTLTIPQTQIQTAPSQQLKPELLTMQQPLSGQISKQIRITEPVSIKISDSALMQNLLQQQKQEQMQLLKYKQPPELILKPPTFGTTPPQEPPTYTQKPIQPVFIPFLWFGDEPIKKPTIKTTGLFEGLWKMRGIKIFDPFERIT